jgi:hypothetical protein
MVAYVIRLGRGASAEPLTKPQPEPEAECAKLKRLGALDVVLPRLDQLIDEANRRAADWDRHHGHER